MADLIGIQIIGLTPAPSLADTTYFPVQRQGIDKAEKVNLQNLSSYLINSSLFSNYVDTSVNSKIAQHIGTNDPHGDRAFANTLLQNHATATDPHGDRVYSDTKLTTALQAHNVANDPHGDRAFTTNAVRDHTIATDPHGDRAYTDGKIVDSNAISKTYTDNQIQTKLTSQLGITIATIIDGKVPSSFIPEFLTFSAKTSFPVTAEVNKLYVDTTGNDVYRWDGSDYINLTPDVDISTLNLTTDNVSEGLNNDRKYLTQNLKTKYDNNISNVINAETLQPYNNIIKEITLDRTVTIKNIVSDSSIDLLDNVNSIVITDDIYTYLGETTTDEDTLTLNEQYKQDILLSIDNSKLYTLDGSIEALTYGFSGTNKYIIGNEKVEINATIGMYGELTEVPVPTTIVSNSSGSVITGKSEANKQVKIYNKLFTEISTANVLSDGNFTANLSTPIIDGSPIYLYTIDGEYKSKDIKYFMPNKGNLRDTSLVTFNSVGLEVKGVTERNSTVVITKEDNTEIGTTTSDSDGFFTVALSEAVIEDQNITVKITNEYAVVETNSVIVNLSLIKPPSEVKLNNERTVIQGKAEENSIIKILNGLEELKTISVDGTGVFSDNIQIPTDINSIVLIISKDVNEYTYEFTMLPYIDEINKPTSIPKVLSSELKVITGNINNINSKNNYIVTLNIQTNKLNINVKNTDNIFTKWVGRLKIKTIEL